MDQADEPAGTAAVDDDAPAGLPETSLTRLPRAAVLAAADSRLHAGLLGDYLDVLASAADSGRRLTRAELEAFRGLGQAAAESGASLRALVDLYLSATWRVWPSLPAVRAADRAARGLTRASSEPVASGQLAHPLRSAGDSVGAVSRTRAAASAVLRASDDAVAAVCEGYEAARTARARSEEALRRELVDDLLTGTSAVGQLLERAGAFGLRLEAPHTVLVVAGNRRFLDGRALTRAAESLLREHSLTDPLVATRDGLLVCVVPEQGDLARGRQPPVRGRTPASHPAAGADAAGGAAAGQARGAAAGPPRPPGSRARAAAAAGSRPPGRRRADESGAVGAGFSPLPAFAPTPEAPAAMAALTRRLRAEPGLLWRVGVGRARSGVAGVRIGFEEARGAAELAGRLGLEGAVVHTDDLLIYKVLLRDREALAELVEAVLSPLRAARSGAGPLIDTLDAYFTTGGVALAAARRLHLSVRALTYRLDRIHALTRHDPTSPTDRYVLQTAVLGARLIGWNPAGG
ncbi:PucR C-terminal helix-turn-helix domain [Frankia torreyi]|uniref:PucR C-terminal helix-turn-helix domain n=1 Tax=Frankia torreyi TaxID=1856 RepID=A0A0D8BJP7_9ACTN|nr:MULTISPECIES: helix-turn-helix domain-containing protein [Frankia]KJE23642.1 PucR C-terminal helix-turn-helix domain [Frankia torreyi]KQC37260.1 PucR family transcriptional regulator [Frankia sp. ACN1ag]KQM05947.1 PucR C-terminal helix-turn-helix domain [Frankia sp. CpI1-P]